MKQRLLRILKGLLLFILFFAVLGAGLYTAAWFAVTYKAAAYINAAWSVPSMRITGDKPSFSSFPLPPEAHFKGEIFHTPSGFKVTFPMLNYSGFPVAGQIQYFESPEGFSVTAPFLEKSFKADYASLQIRPPFHMPGSLRKADIAAWQSRKEPVQIIGLTVNSGPIAALASGTIGLGDDLQLDGTLTAKIFGMEALLGELIGQENQRSLTTAKSLLRMMTQKDEKTGQPYFESKIMIQGESVYFGPLKMSVLPLMTWEETPPAAAP